MPESEPVTIATFAIRRAYPAAGRPKTSGEVDLDHVRRAGDVHRGAGGDHDPVARLDQPGLAGGVDRDAPQLLDVLLLADPQRRHAPLERHLLDGPAVVRQADD